MKRVKYLLFAFILFVFVGAVYAKPSFSIQPNRFSIQEGQSVTLTIKLSGVMGWDINVASSGATNGCNNHWVEDSGNGSNISKTLQTTCKASGTGKIVLVVTGKVTDNELNAVNISDTTEITVTEYVAPTKSSINTLNSLEVQGYELTPVFDPNVTEYSTTVPAGTESVYISITKKDSKSVANGDFKDVKLSEGANRCVITVTAEDGGKKTYVVIVNVEAEDPIVVSVGGDEYTVVTNPKLLETPKGFELSTVTIDEKEVPAFVNEKAKLTLVGLKDVDGNISLYVYDNGNYKPYEVIEVNGFVFIVMEPEETLRQFENTKNITINDKEYKVYYNEDEDIVLVYGMNVATGNIGWYRYDTEEQTFLRYKEEKGTVVKEKSGKNYLFIAILFGGCLGFAIIILLILLAMNNSKDKKNKKLIAILESKMHNANGEPIHSNNKPAFDADNTLDMKFIELIDKEAEEKRIEATQAIPVVEEPVEVLDVEEEKEVEETPTEEPKELSKKELKRLAKQLKKEEEREAKEMRDEFLATRENIIISDDDILEEIPNSQEVLNPKKKNKKKKR